ncbi:hypothetical protein ACFXD5_26745 [Streptomyces sp. NPDC059385]|uniref:hypothetical protein n=1 Tax=Streptomyces sp. NPDC059385 TaxID=3346817 RepID=UPI003675AF87
MSQPPAPEPPLAAIAAARQYTDDLLRLPNVIGVGVSYKVVGGRRTDTDCVIVYVTRKEPPANLSALHRVPRELSVADERVCTDVTQIAPLGFLSDTKAYRPIRGGCQLSTTFSFPSGTAGGVFFDRREPKNHVLLTNAHCLFDPADPGALPPSPLDLVAQPSHGDIIGEATRIVPWRPLRSLQFKPPWPVPSFGTNYEALVDAGIVEVPPSISARYEVIDIAGRHPFWASRPYRDLRVVHRGWAGLRRTGTVEAIETTIFTGRSGSPGCMVGYGGVGAKTVFTIRADTDTAIPGDSGSLVVDSEGKATRGLVFASDERPGGLTAACDIIDVMYGLDIETALTSSKRFLVTDVLMSQWKKLGATRDPGLIDIHLNKFDHFLANHLRANAEGQLSGTLYALLNEEPGRAIAHAILSDDDFVGLLNRAIGPWLVQPNAFEMLEYQLPEGFTSDLLAAFTRLNRISPDTIDIDWLANVLQDTAGRSVREVLERKVRQ